MPAVLASDADVTREVVTVEYGKLAEPPQRRLAHAFSVTDSQSWCSGCGRPQTDPMTGLMDRWMWTQRAIMLLDRFGDGRDPITLLIADLDRFKAINDSAGHVAGDAVLAAVAKVIRSEMRSGDLWGRYGSYAGDEFVGLLPGASLSGGLAAAERLQRRIGMMRIRVDTPMGDRELGRVSVSIGLASHRSGRSIEDTIGCADVALLTAKRGGRSRVCVAGVQTHAGIAYAATRYQGNEW
jgi:diguanylate cyclase (GGDEF)-like protein